MSSDGNRTCIDAPTGAERAKVRKQRSAFPKPVVATLLNHMKPSSRSGYEFSTAGGFNDPGGKNRRSGAAGALIGAA